MASPTGLMHLPHDGTFFGDRLMVPNRINALFWEVIPPFSVYSMPMFDVDFISVGTRDASLSESIRALISGFSDGANDFIKMGYMDVQGWIIGGDRTLTESLTATPDQIIDDYIRKVPVPQVNPGETVTADQQLQTLRETVGDDSNISAEGEENVIDPDEQRTIHGQDFQGLATRHPAVIEQAAWYDLGPHMFYEERIYLGTRHGNAIPVGEQQQRYTAAVRTNISGKASRGKYAVVIFTVSMPHLNAFGQDHDESDEPLAPWASWDDMIMAYQRAPLNFGEMQDEVSLANARYRFRQDMQLTAGSGQAASTGMTGHWGITGDFEDYIQQKRQYSVKQGIWEQKPMMASIRVNRTITAPFMLIPQRL